MRRGRTRLMLFFKIVRGVLAIPMPSYTCPATTLQQNPSVPSPEIHCCELWHLGVREFFFPSTINLWNSLPAEVITQANLKDFKDGLDHF